MNDEKRKALEAAGWKFGDAEDFLNEGRAMNVDEAIEIATSTAITMSKLEMAEVSEVLAAEIERLRAELAIYTSPKRMVIKKLPWMCGNCGEQTVDCIRPYGESLLGTCSNCGSEWVS